MHPPAFGTGQDRSLDGFCDFDVRQKPGVETKEAKDIAILLTQPPPRSIS